MRIEHGISFGTRHGFRLASQSNDELCYGLCRVLVLWRGWTFLAPLIHVLCEWCHSFSWPLLVSLINTRIRRVREWVNSWRYFWSKCTPLLIAFAECIAIQEDAVAKKPKNLTMEEAASIPLVGLTAWQVLVERAKLSPGQKVLIHAGSGGVGTVAIQLAKHLGATVATTTSTVISSG